MLAYALFWDPKPEIFTLPYLHWPILWYGLLFALGFLGGFPLFVSTLARYLAIVQPASARETLRKEATGIADKLLVFMIIATIVGARLGHFLFYEHPATYLHNPWEILRVWEGGLASHGAVLAILVALALFRFRIRAHYPTLSWIKLLDLISPPAALIAGCIRIGNFFNQEILGTPSTLPWAIVFGHPADHSLPTPRHPAQLYEAIAYMIIFFILWCLSRRPLFLAQTGKLSGLLLIGIFAFRSLIECVKEEQSHLLSSSFPLTMGQLLSVPILVLGGWLLVKSYPIYYK
jgi:prolipoprotein diacylglyceryl transferase